MSKSVRLRAAHVFIGKEHRAVVSSSWRVIQPETNGARVVFSGARFSTARPKPSLAGVLAALGKGDDE